MPTISGSLSPLITRSSLWASLMEFYVSSISYSFRTEDLFASGAASNDKSGNTIAYHWPDVKTGWSNMTPWTHCSLARLSHLTSNSASRSTNYIVTKLSLSAVNVFYRHMYLPPPGPAFPYARTLIVGRSRSKFLRRRYISSLACIGLARGLCSVLHALLT